MARWQAGLCARPVRLAAKCRIRTWLLISIALTATACSQLDRLTAVSARDTARASVLGIPDARFLPTDIKAISVLGQRLYEREAKYGAADNDPHAKEHFLARYPAAGTTALLLPVSSSGGRKAAHGLRLRS
jgi:hypothetical protein